MQVKKKVFIVYSLNSGGIENYILRYLNFDRELTPIIICKSGHLGELQNQYIRRVGEDNIIPFRLKYMNIFSYFKFARFLKKNRVCLICDFTGNFAGLTLFFALLAGVKYRIAFYRGSTNHFNETFLNNFYNSIVHYLVKVSSTRILSNSYAALEFFFPKYKSRNKCKVIYNDIDLNILESLETRESMRAKLNIPLNAFVVGHTGRYNIAKNHKTIIEVAIKLCSRYEDLYFVLAGKDTDKYLKDIVEQSGFCSRIKLLGYRADVPDILRALDLFYFPSITEGQPNSLLEAMVVGLPVIASNIEPIKESVPEDMYQYLLSPLDVDSAVSVIEDCYLYPQNMSRYILKDWAIGNYGKNRWFNEFKKELY